MVAIGNTTPGAEWTELRDSAVGAVARGWPIVPGRPVLGISACDLRPVDQENWQDTPITDWEQAHAVWTRSGYGVLLVCGQGVDVLQLPALLATDAVPLLRASGLAGPVAVLHGSLWLVFVASGDCGLLPGLQRLPGVHYHGRGAWVPVPPTELGHTRARWHAPPQPGTALPASQAVQTRVLQVHGCRVGS